MLDKSYKNIFRLGSKTFFYSSYLFSPSIRNEVATLYAFVRTFDDLVDSQPPQKELFFELKDKYYESLNRGVFCGHFVLDGFISLQKKYNFNQGWVDAFFISMEADLNHKPYQTLDELNNYMFGSAVVVGYMLCSIFGVKSEAYSYARSLAEAFQYINFIRDIEEDLKLNRFYLPASNYKKFGFLFPSKQEFLSNPGKFCDYIRSEIKYFYKLIKFSDLGFRYLSAKVGLAVLTARYLYLYTALVIYRKPQIVFAKKVKPSYFVIFVFAFVSVVTYFVWSAKWKLKKS